MKVIFSIAKNEFRYLFYSPVAWFVLIVFLFQCALFYTGPVLNGVNMQDLLMKNNPEFKQFTNSITEGLYLKTEFFPSIIRNLYLFIPILTMGLISREVNGNTSSLLYSSPVNIRRIVLGKYIGIMMYNLLLVLIICIFLVSGMLSIKSVDYGPLIAAGFSFYLLVCTYSAIGLFMSSLSNYQIVSALGTFVTLFALSNIGELWQRYDFIRDLTYFLSLQNRTFKMLVGLIVSRDVIYFVLVSAMFVLFTMIRLKNHRDNKSKLLKFGRYVFVLLVVAMTGYITSRPMFTGYLDTTDTQKLTIHPRTQQIIKEFGDSTLEVTLFTNLLGGGVESGLPEVRNSRYLTFWDPLIRFKPDIKFKYEYYYDNDPSMDDSALFKIFPGKSLKEIAGEVTSGRDDDLSMYTPPEEIRKRIDLGPESYRLVMQLKYRGRTTWLRTFDDPYFWPDEMVINAAFRRLLDPEMPLVCYASGDLERNVYKSGEREFGLHSASKAGRGALVNTGYDVDTVNLNVQDIPERTAILVLADPKRELSPAAMSKLKSYVEKGGNMLVMGEPGKQYVLNPFLKTLGLQLNDGQLVQPDKEETPEKVWSYLHPAGGQLSEGMEFMKHLKPADSTSILTPGVTSLKYAGNEFKMELLASTNRGKTWLKAGNLVVDSTLPAFNSLEGDIMEPSFPTIIQLTRQVNGRQQRIIVSGDADFASNMRLMLHNNNLKFIMPCYSWLVYNRYPIYIPEKPAQDTLFTISARAAEIQKTFFVWILPAIILIAGTVLLVRRKRK